MVLLSYKRKLVANFLIKERGLWNLLIYNKIYRKYLINDQDDDRNKQTCKLQ